MATCTECSSLIMFGGRKHEGAQFCSVKCEQKGLPYVSMAKIQSGLLAIETNKIWQGSCPICSGCGPVDMYTAHSVWSALIITNWVSQPQLSCKSCGRKEMAIATAKSALLGWWGFPWGIIMTPVQIVRNVTGMIMTPDTTQPSKQLKQFVGKHIAANAQIERENEPIF